MLVLDPAGRHHQRNGLGFRIQGKFKSIQVHFRNVPVYTLFPSPLIFSQILYCIWGENLITIAHSTRRVIAIFKVHWIRSDFWHVFLPLFVLKKCKTLCFIFSPWLYWSCCSESLPTITNHHNNMKVKMKSHCNFEAQMADLPLKNWWNCPELHIWPKLPPGHLFRPIMQ